MGQCGFVLGPGADGFVDVWCCATPRGTPYETSYLGQGRSTVALAAGLEIVTILLIVRVIFVWMRFLLAHGTWEWCDASGKFIEHCACVFVRCDCWETAVHGVEFKCCCDAHGQCLWQVEVAAFFCFCCLLLLILKLYIICGGR